MVGWMVGWMDRWMDRRSDRWTSEWMAWRMGRQTVMSWGRGWLVSRMLMGSRAGEGITK